MALEEREEFWNDFLRQDDTRKALKLQQKAFIQQSAVTLRKKYYGEAKIIEEVLSECSNPTRELIFPIMENPVVHRLLRTILRDSIRNCNKFEDELHSNQDVISRLEEINEEYTKDPEEFKTARSFWDSQYDKATKIVDDEISGNKETSTWRDMPEEELVERLSKGEIIPRDEWIPGISKDKRLLNTESMKSHLELGETMQEEGKKAYLEGSFDTAYIRFSQGVQLLNWVRTSDTDLQEKVDCMYLGFLRNLSQTALKLEKYQEAIKAATTIIQDIDEHDSKARYRRGMAYTLLGILSCAKDDFLFIIKSPYSDETSVKAAKARLKELKKIVSNYKVRTREAVVRSVEKDLFSANRAQSLGSSSMNNEAEIFRKNSEISSAMASSGRRSWFDEEIQLPKSPHNVNDQKANEEQYPHINEDDTVALLEDLLNAYTEKQVETKLNELRWASDFDPRRLLIRTRNFLPHIQKPIFAQYGFCDPIHKVNLRKVESNINFWRKRSAEVEELRKACWEAVFADIVDFD